VIAFYANETTGLAFDAPNTSRLLALLTESRTPVAAAIKSSIELDAAAFPAAVSTNITDLFAISRISGYDVVVFTNALTLINRFLVQRHSSNGPEAHTFAFPAAPSDPALAYSPLSHPVFFAAALDQIGTLYAGQPTDVILITDSHGDESMALMPRVAADFVNIDANALLTALARPSRVALPWRRGDELTVRKSGTDKIAYWTVLADASRRFPLYFPMVLRLSCESGIASWNELQVIPATVTKIGSTGINALEYQQINYISIFDALREGDDFLVAFEAVLRRQGIEFPTSTTLYLDAGYRLLTRFGPALLFLPLGVWIYLAARDSILRRAPRRGAAG
jgi:hypothetical protein